jgi:hypothetical protein
VKKTLKKLALSRETLGTLDNPRLREALGAWGTMETECCATWQPCSNANCYTDTTPTRLQ